ncbi:MAG: hypothetical protein BWY17_04335 [Deltaproteobacteria bacterium ADurb.Bin207]|nr:MAG: hypothetical protein BWY17_04335 [Deltaproteobacteria bacterium ADurb.Bin207]
MCDSHNRTCSGVILNMHAHVTILLLALSLFGCRESPVTNPVFSTTPSLDPPAASAPVSSVQPEDSSPPVPPPAPFMSDSEFGALIGALSEPTGDFPSDNYVSNETSYLHVAQDLHDDKLRGTAYVGVGPEQNYTYIALMQPAMAYIVDIRRQNMLQHLLFRALMEDADCRSVFLARLTCRPHLFMDPTQSKTASFDTIADALAKTEPPSSSMQQALIQESLDRTHRLMERLGMTLHASDSASLRKILVAFSKEGLGLAYSMKGSGRKYPSIRELLAMTSDDGGSGSYLSDEASYLRVRDMVRDNRVVPIVGDFSGARALRGVAADMRQRGLTLGVLYTSNVEQYLFEAGSFGQFVSNVESFPLDSSSRFLRVWFDQGRAHPQQRKGHRTTSLLMPVQPFLERHHKRPFPTYWHVTTTVMGDGASP